MGSNRKVARELAHKALAEGKPLEWFETLYRRAGDDSSVIPWADMTVNPNLVAWLEREGVEGAGRRALIVGCGLGDDAEALSTRGFRVTAFDISEACIGWCRRRFPKSGVDFRQADLLSAPQVWSHTFDFVFEAYTLQVLPEPLRAVAICHLAEFVAANGQLLVIARGRDPGEDPGQMPWPLTTRELDKVAGAGLTMVRFEDFLDAEDPPVRRFRVEYRRSM